MPVDGYTAFADLLPEPMLIVSGGGVILSANPAAEQLGTRPAELVGRRLAELVSDSEVEVRAYLRQCSRSKQRVLGVLRWKSTSPEPQRAEGAVLKPRAGADEAIIALRLIPRKHSIERFLVLNQRIVELNREVVRRKRVEEELRAQREWLQVTLTSIGDAVITTDVHGRVTFMNPRAEVLTGWPQAEAAGQLLETVFRIVNEVTRASVENPVTKVIEHGKSVGLANHTVLIARDGAENAIEDTAAPIREPGGELQGIVLVFHDVGERRILERQLIDRAQKLAEADRRKDEFLAMLAHELRNPLAPVRNSLHILQNNASSPKIVERVRQIMDRQVGHMVRMIDDLLDVSRITRGKIELRKEPTDLAKIAQLVVDDFSPRFEEAGISTATDFSAAPVWIDGDPTRLTQIIGNLLENAVKFSNPGGAVAVRLSIAPDGAAELSIKDSGIGIDPQVLPHVFEPFAQADRTLDRSRGGLGLGLAMVKGLVELHGGSVAASSDGVYRGTEVVVRLPRCSAPDALPPEPPPEPCEGARCRVLVVDDNRDTVESLRLVLEQANYQTEAAYSGVEAVELAERTRPNVVVCDIGLPGMDGFAVAAALRRETATARAMLIAVTGYGEGGIREKALSAGFNEHLVKPVVPSQLFALLPKANH